MGKRLSYVRTTPQGQSRLWGADRRVWAVVSPAVRLDAASLEDASHNQTDEDEGEQTEQLKSHHVCLTLGYVGDGHVGVPCRVCGTETKEPGLLFPRARA
jgi:hypothetical protein